VVNVSTTQIVETRGGGLDLDPGDPFQEWYQEFGDRGPDGDKPRKRRQNSLGSGFIIDASGYVVTNSHVVEQADKISVILADDTVHDAKLVGRDPRTDVALLKIDAKRDLPVVTWGDSDKMRVGDWAVAIGNPFGLGGTVTAGIISARSRDIDERIYDDFLQTDAAINRGNSGGPLFNTAGEVIGINTAIFSATGGSVGVGFASASNLVRPIVEDLRKYGRTRRGWIGVQYQSVNAEMAESLNLQAVRGALVSAVTPDGPAAKAGIQAGDVILSFDGNEITKMRRLPRMVAETDVDKVCELSIWRKGRAITANVKVGELEDVQPTPVVLTDGDLRRELPRVELVQLGITVSEITERVRRRFDIADGVVGLVVVEVDDDSNAADQGLRRGDVIDEIAQTPVSTVSDAQSALKSIGKDDRKAVLLRVQTGQNIRYVGVKPGE
ncbi:MAG: Do family serine endopeptidase, partial [Alphaproteobacteria bacterium]|nr:Do family serine endopeptidase [Alphaproteobacteria bacterium]